ncbi:MAG: 2-oxoacid:acceptor oxidoreductase subunit alpha [Candidatus Thorarchaeota archaeon]
MNRNITIVLAGAAGQGIETVAGMLSSIIKDSGYNVFVTRELMSRIRGGTNSLQLRVSSKRVAAYLRRIDIAIPLNSTAMFHLRQYGRVSNETIVIGEKEFLQDESSSAVAALIEVPFTDLAKKIGGKLYSNTVAAGLIASIFDVDEAVVSNYLSSRFSSKGENVVQNNLAAYRRGFEIGSGLKKEGKLAHQLEKNPQTKEDLLLSGTDAIAMGAIAGGCNFISSYPMSPSTGVLTFLSQQSRKFGIIVDQAEDEIAAMNKNIGAWYAGARAMVTTSGGGFALMTEGLSLSGMLESPMVIHLAQRPGPATGLPTRTEQGDLNFVLYAGHGEFPRVVFAPGTLDQGFTLARLAFNTAAKFQVPVFLLTDQFFVDSSYNTPRPDLNWKIEKHIIETNSKYKRYKFTENGVSPRGVPNHGTGLVVADSDEHDESGHITEDLNLRPKMVNKRLYRKLELLRNNAIPPTLVGDNDYDVLLVAWGSNYHAVREALERTGSDGIAMLHFSQVYPISQEAGNHLRRAKRIMSVENNATGQFANLIEKEMSLSIPQEGRLLSYNGLPIPVEEIVEFIDSLLSKEGLK